MRIRTASATGRALRAVAWVAASWAGVGRCASVDSTFASSAESWSLVGLATHPKGASPTPIAHPISWSGSGGNPGGYVYGIDIWPDTFYFSAPTAFLAGKSNYAGGKLTYDIRDVGTGDYGTNEDAAVILVKAGGGKALYQSLVTNAGVEFATQSFTLAAGNGWKVNGIDNTAANATASDFADVLGDLGAIYVLADYRQGSETTSMDNVRLTSVNSTPEPGTVALAMLAAAGVLGRRGRRR